MFTTDISSKYRCHCADEDDIKYFRESLAKALGIDLAERLKNREEKKD
jgi:hypothetical protein